MAEGLDVVRSLLRLVARRTGARLRGLGPMAELWKRLGEARDGIATVPEADITAAIAHAPEVLAASVLARRGALHLDLAFDDGTRWQGRLVPGAVAFAPRGAKEVAFAVDPPEAAGDRRVRGVVAVLGGLVARALWSVLIPSTVPRGDAVSVDRDGVWYRVDLRTVPEVRRLSRAGLLASALDVLVLREIACEDGALRLHLGLPELRA